MQKKRYLHLHMLFKIQYDTYTKRILKSTHDKKAVMDWINCLRTLDFRKRVTNIIHHQAYIKQNLFFQYVIVSGSSIQKLNAQFRGKNQQTDVLTFHFSDYDSSKHLPMAEIYIAINVAEKQAAEHNITLASELCLLSVHGLLHALGFDHETEGERLIMHNHEQDLLEAMGLSYCPTLVTL